VNVVNTPRVSRFIAGTYAGLAVFIAAIIAFFAYASFFTPFGIVGLAATAVLTFVEAIMLLILTSILKTRYVLTDETLFIRANRLIGGNKHIHLREITSVERTLMPVGLRLFGASFYGGYYRIPGLGRAFMVITNFTDGVLIKTKSDNYVITPEKPEDFIRAIDDAVRPFQNA
jgi:hypothetical protein